jgi:hypothetical protein
MLARKLATLGAAGMIAIGIAGVIAPQRSARGYGIESEDANALAYVRAAAARDVAIGLVLLRASRKGGKKAFRTALACAALVPLADMTLVAVNTGDPRRLAVHAAGLAGIAAVWALATFGES